MPKDDLSGDLFSSISPPPLGKPPAASSAREPEADLERLAERLDASSDYRVLRRFEPPESYAQSVKNCGHALFIDLETTGLDAAADQIIELAAVSFTFDTKSGDVGTVGRAYASLEDPGRPIPEAASIVTGITDEMVRGRRIDDGAVSALLSTAELVIAHNAAFDRPFLERRLPAFAKVRWACSMADVDWNGEGYSGRGLENLLTQHCRAFFDAHRAEVDCRAGIHLLATPFADGGQPLQQLLRRAATTWWKISAVGAPFDFKELLKARGYKWFAGDGARPKAWYRQVTADDLDAEREWLTKQIYGGKYRATEEEEDPLRRFVQR